MKAGGPVLQATAACQDTFCPFYKEFATWQEAKKAAHDHYRDTKHVVRAEQIRTVLFGWEL